MVDKKEPNLSFKLEPYREWKGSGESYDKGEFRLVCENGDQDSVKVSKISLLFGGELVFEDKFENKQSLVIHGCKIEKIFIPQDALDSLEKLYKLRDIKDCEVVVDADGKHYTYYLNITIFDQPGRLAKKVLHSLGG